MQLSCIEVQDMVMASNCWQISFIFSILTEITKVHLKDNLTKKSISNEILYFFTFSHVSKWKLQNH